MKIYLNKLKFNKKFASITGIFTCILLCSGLFISNNIKDKTESSNLDYSTKEALSFKFSPITTEEESETTEEISKEHTSETEPTVVKSNPKQPYKKPSETKSDNDYRISTISTVVNTENTTGKEDTNLNESEDVFLIAAAVCREAGGESIETQMLVANVIINRVNSSKYPNTVRGVLTQKNQYGTMWKYGVSFPKWATENIKEQCYSVAKRILNGERVCPENVIYQAEFKQGSGVYSYVGGMYFCYA